MRKRTYQATAVKLATLLDALSHPARLQIMLHLAKCKSCHAGEISDLLPLSQSTVSQHMAKLRAVGFITCSPVGICQNYCIVDENFNLMKTYFSQFIQTMERRRKKQTDCCLKSGKRLNALK